MSEFSPEEKLFIDVVRMNQSRKIIGIRKQLVIGSLAVTFSWRSKKNPMGRFGGGWNWKFGFQAARKTLIVSLLICEIDFRPAKRNAP